MKYYEKIAIFLHYFSIRFYQWSFPQPFCISPEKDYEISLKNILDWMKKNLVLEEDAQKMDEIQEQLFLNKDAILEVCNQYFKLKKNLKILSLNSKEGRSMEKSLRTIYEILESAQIEVNDHTSQIFDAGLSLTVLAWEEHPDLTKNTIVETISPSIFFNQKLIQKGEVIVGKNSK